MILWFSLSLTVDWPLFADLWSVEDRPIPSESQAPLLTVISIEKRSAGCSLRGLQGVNLYLLGSRGLSDVCGHAAFPGSPLDSGLRENQAILAGGKLFGFLAAVALFDNGVTTPTIELTTALVHEKTLNTLLYAIANHGYHIPSLKWQN